MKKVLYLALGIICISATMEKPASHNQGCMCFSCLENSHAAVSQIQHQLPNLLFYLKNEPEFEINEEILNQHILAQRLFMVGHQAREIKKSAKISKIITQKMISEQQLYLNPISSKQCSDSCVCLKCLGYSMEKIAHVQKRLPSIAIKMMDIKKVKVILDHGESIQAYALLEKLCLIRKTIIDSKVVPKDTQKILIKKMSGRFKSSKDEHSMKDAITNDTQDMEILTQPNALNLKWFFDEQAISF